MKMSATTINFAHGGEQFTAEASSRNGRGRFEVIAWVECAQWVAPHPITVADIFGDCDPRMSVWPDARSHARLLALEGDELEQAEKDAVKDEAIWEIEAYKRVCFTGSIYWANQGVNMGAFEIRADGVYVDGALIDREFMESGDYWLQCDRVAQAAKVRELIAAVSMV
jgi:hypothetical protein